MTFENAGEIYKLDFNFADRTVIVGIIEIPFFEMRKDKNKKAQTQTDNPAIEALPLGKLNALASFTANAGVRAAIP